MRFLCMLAALPAAFGSAPDSDRIQRLVEFEYALERALEFSMDFRTVWDLSRGDTHFYTSLAALHVPNMQSVLSPYLRLVAALNVPESQEYDFLVKSQILKFCGADPNSLRKVLTLAHVQMYTSKVNGISEPVFYPTDSVVLETLFYKIERFCPDLMKDPLMKNLQLLHAVADIGETIGEPILYIDVFAFNEPIETVAGLLNDYPPEYLRHGIGAFLTPSGDKLKPLGNVRRIFQSLHQVLLDNGVLTTISTNNTREFIISNDKKILRFLGRVLALALIHEQPLMLDFDELFYAYLINGKLELQDAQYHPQIADAYSRIMEASNNVELKRERLFINGSRLHFTVRNRMEVFDSVIKDAYSLEQLERMAIVRVGFVEIIPAELFKDLNISPRDLKLIMAGTDTTDWDEISSNLRFKGYNSSSRAVKTAFHGLLSPNRIDRMEFLEKSTGSPSCLSAA